MKTQVRKSWFLAIVGIVLLAAFALVSEPVSADKIGDLEITPTVSGETLTDADYEFDEPYNLLNIKSLKIAQTTEINVPVEATGEGSIITGQVTDKDGKVGVKDVRVVYTQTINNDQVTRETTTDENGDYTLPAIPPGDGTIEFTKAGYAGENGSNSKTITNVNSNLQVDFVIQSIKAPQVTNFSPEGESNGLTGTIAFTFDKAMAGTQPEAATVTIDGGSVGKGIWSADYHTYTAAYQVFNYNTQYTVTIKNFKSWNGTTMAESSQYAFKTKDGPLNAGEFEITPTDGETLLTVDDYVYDIDNGVLTVKSSTPITIKNKANIEKTKHHIVINPDITANLTLAGVNIGDSGLDFCALEVVPKTKDTDTTLNLTLAEDSVNTLQSGKNRAGLEVTAGAALVIDGKGSLTAGSDGYGAGIGGGYGGYGGTIEITGGRVVAKSTYGDGIGSGDSGSPENTTIAYKGGSVDAKSSTGKALSVSPNLPAAGQYLWKVDERSDALYKLGSNIPYNWAENEMENFTAFRDPLGDIPVIQTQPAGFTCLQDEGGKTLEVTLEKTIINTTYQWIVDKGDGKGFVAIEGATQSTYTVPTDTISTWHYRVNITTTGALPVFIQSDTATVTVNPHPQPSYETTITLVDEANTPVPDAQVSLSKNETVIREGKTDQNGKLRLRDLAAGLYMAKVEKEGYQPMQMDLWINNTNVPVDLMMRKNVLSQIVSGTVTYLSENQEITPVSGATVTIAGPNAKVDTTTDESGHYEVSYLPSGNYYVTASHHDHGDTTVALEHDNSKSIVDLHLQSGEPASFSLSGRVLGKDMRPLAGVDVVLFYEGFSSPIMTVITNNQGEYKFDGLQNAFYDITVSEEGYKDYSMFMSVLSCSKVHNIELTYNRYPITGTITGEPIQPLPGAEVNLFDANGFSIAEINTDENGGFNLEDIPNGSYTLVANCGGYQEGRVAVVVAGNQVSTALRLTKVPEPDTYSFTGVIRNSAGGEPVPSADVTLNPVATTGGLFKTVSAANEQTVQTDANGYYAFTNVEAGSYTITVGAEGYERTTSEVFEVPGTLSLDLVLAKKAGPTPQPDPTPDPKPSPTVKSGRSSNTGDETPIAFLFVASATALGGIWVLAKGRRMKP